MPRHSTRPRHAPEREVPLIDELRADQRERRDRIVTAAAELMIDVDYGDIAVKDVAERAGVALGTLYRYFGSKDHLMACALLAWSSHFPDRAAPATDAPAADRVRAVYQRAARAFEREPRVFDVLMQVQASRDPHAAEVFADFAERQTAAFAAALSDLPSDVGSDVVDIMSAVLTENLRSCQLGQCTRAEVRHRIDRAAHLLLGG